MQNIKSDKQGFTLIETVVVIAIFIIISFVLSNLYINYYQAYYLQEAIIKAAGSASFAANEIQNAALQADHIVTSHNFSGTIYSSDQNVLVLEISSIDSSENIVSGKYDYMVFYATGTILYKLVQADASSSRISGQKQLSNTLSTITFAYNNGDLSQANKIDVDINMQAVAGHQTIPYHLHQEIYLRNL